MTTAVICATREVSWWPSYYRGEQYDADLGLYDLRARYYNPLTGRFLSRDPEDGHDWDPRSLHKYLYAAGDATDAIDPTGRELFESALVQGGSALTAFEAFVAAHATAIALVNCIAGAVLALADFIKENGHWDGWGYAGGGAALWGCVTLGGS